MSITGALLAGVSGLRANATAISGISENIANANTVGYKRSFAHMITSSASNGEQDSSGVLSVVASQVTEVSKTGGLVATQSSTDLSISGNGLFVVTENPNETNYENFFFTRAGSFVPDGDGNLINAAGYYLAGFPYDIDGTLVAADRGSFAALTTVNVLDPSVVAESTSTIAVRGNLPSQSTAQSTPPAPFVTSSEYFSPLGVIERLSFSWQASATVNQWTVSVNDASGAALGNVTIDFNDSGSLSGSPRAFTNINNLSVSPASFALDPTTGIATISLNNGATPQTIEVHFGSVGSFEGLTQFSGDFSAAFEKDGTNTGVLARTEFDGEGTMYGIFDNGFRRPLFEVPLGVIDNANGLAEHQGNAFVLTGKSGGFQLLSAKGGSLGTINSGALESSNVDIAQEMSDLIKVQRSFSVNASVITTVDEMLDETNRLKR